MKLINVLVFFIAIASGQLAQAANVVFVHGELSFYNRFLDLKSESPAGEGLNPPFPVGGRMHLDREGDKASYPA